MLFAFDLITPPIKENRPAHDLKREITADDEMHSCELSSSILGLETPTGGVTNSKLDSRNKHLICAKKVRRLDKQFKKKAIRNERTIKNSFFISRFFIASGNDRYALSTTHAFFIAA